MEFDGMADKLKDDVTNILTDYTKDHMLLINGDILIALPLSKFSQLGADITKEVLGNVLDFIKEERDAKV